MVKNIKDTGKLSFAVAFYSFSKLMQLEQRLENFIKEARCPSEDTRKFLRCQSTLEISNTALFQFFQHFFNKIGFGDLEIVEFKPLQYFFIVRNCSVCDLVPKTKEKRVCHLTAKALFRLFSEDLGVNCRVEETECRREGYENCKFSVNLEPLSTYICLLSPQDDALLLKIQENPEVVNTNERFKSLFNTLRMYNLIDNDGKLTRIAEAYLLYLNNFVKKERIFDPPWKKMKEISVKISSASSFAQAFTTLEESNQIKNMNSPPTLTRSKSQRRMEQSKSFLDKFVKLLNKKDYSEKSSDIE